MTIARTALALWTALLAVSCGGNQSEPQSPQQPQTQTFASETQAPAPAADTAPTPAATAGSTTEMSTTQNPAATQPAPQEMLTDGQIAAIVSAANKGEIEQAKVAQTNAKDAKVKKFAALMVQHHGDNQKAAEKLLQKIGVTPLENDVSTKLENDSKQLVDKLKGEKGADFDRDYIDAQVSEHQQVLDMMDQKLIPQAKNAELKGAIQDFRPKVEMHLKSAQEIQQALPPKK